MPRRECADPARAKLTAMHDSSHLPNPSADPSVAIIAACKAAKTRLACASDALALAVAMAELVVTLSTLEEALIEWAMAASPDVAAQARSAIVLAARRDA